MRKNLIIDGQILQTNAWHRGMGKYTLQVLQKLNKNAPPGLGLSIIFNNNLACDPQRYEEVSRLCPRFKQLKVDLALTSDKLSEADTYREQLETHINDNFEQTENFYLLTSLFFFDFFAEFPSNCHKLMLFYDLTPLLFWKDLGGYFPPELYMGRFQKILEADQIFSISETTRRDIIDVFGMPPESVININGGFTKIAESTRKPQDFEVPSEYILFPTGDLPHKNNELAVRGYREYAERVGQKNSIPILITSHFQDLSKTRLAAISDNIIFTENVSDEELEWLYENAAAVLFASKYEGLGMPILDAVASKKPIITSRIPVFEEMSPDAFYYFDPTDPDDLAQSLDDALKQKSFTKKSSHYPAILKKYTWANTCERLLSGLDEFGSRATSHVAAETQKPKPKLAVAALHPGIHNQLGRVAEVLYFSLTKYFDVEYYFDGNGYHYREMERPTFLDCLDTKVYDISKLSLRSYKHYDRVLFLIDNSALPSRLAQRACVLPGVVASNIEETCLNKQQEYIYELLVENQHNTVTLPNSSYESCHALAKQLFEDVINSDPKDDLQAEKIIRGVGTNSRIIKRLLALNHNA